MSKMASVSEV